MALWTPNQGELELLDKMLKDALSTNENYILKLYTNDYTPDDSTVTNSFTQASFTNYQGRTLLRSSWADAATVSNKAETSYGSGPQSWTCGTNGATVYGYYVEAVTSGITLWAERFSTSRVLANGDVLNITPKFTLNREAT